MQVKVENQISHQTIGELVNYEGRTCNKQTIWDRRVTTLRNKLTISTVFAYDSRRGRRGSDQCQRVCDCTKRRGLNTSTSQQRAKNNVNALIMLRLKILQKVARASFRPSRHGTKIFQTVTKIEELRQAGSTQPGLLLTFLLPSVTQRLFWQHLTDYHAS